MSALLNHLKRVTDEVPTFLDSIFSNLAQATIDVSLLQLDHVCYRVESDQDYDQAKQEFLNVGVLLSEENVGGRLVCTFRLNEPFKYQERSIWLLELPQVKPGSPYAAGLEHCEFVIGDKSFDDFMKLYPSVNWDVKAANKENNPDIKVSFKNNTSVKFHHEPLDTVIEKELALRN